MKPCLSSITKVEYKLQGRLVIVENIVPNIINNMDLLIWRNLELKFSKLWDVCDYTEHLMLCCVVLAFYTKYNWKLELTSMSLKRLHLLISTFVFVKKKEMRKIWIRNEDLLSHLMWIIKSKPFISSTSNFPHIGNSIQV